MKSLLFSFRFIAERRWKMGHTMEKTIRLRAFQSDEAANNIRIENEEWGMGGGGG